MGAPLWQVWGEKHRVMYNSGAERGCGFRREGPWASGATLDPLGLEDPVPVSTSPVAKSCVTRVIRPEKGGFVAHRLLMCISFIKCMAGTVLALHRVVKSCIKYCNVRNSVPRPGGGTWQHFPPANYGGSF